MHEGLDLRLGGMGGPTHPHGRGHALSMVGGMDMGAGADMDGMGGLTMSMPMPMSSAAALGMNLGMGGYVDVGGGASGGEEDVSVGMMLGVYHPKYGGGEGHNVRILLSLFIIHIGADVQFIIILLLWWVIDGKIILDVDESFVRIVAFVTPWA